MWSLCRRDRGYIESKYIQCDSIYYTPFKYRPYQIKKLPQLYILISILLSEIFIHCTKKFIARETYSIYNMIAGELWIDYEVTWKDSKRAEYKFFGIWAICGVEINNIPRVRHWLYTAVIDLGPIGIQRWYGCQLCVEKPPHRR